LTANHSITIAPANITTEISNLERHHGTINESLPGDYINFYVKDVSAEQLEEGFVVGDAENNPPKAC
jgi:translation elongation factor EF-1alpha